MAESYGSNGNGSSPDKMRAWAESVYNSFGQYRNRLTTTYKSTRLQYTAVKQPNGVELTTAPTARALATVIQFVSLADSTPHVTVIPKNNTESEDERTNDIERFLQGIPRAIQYTGMHPYDAALHNFAEGGLGYVLLDVDTDEAIAGEFPFTITAPSPESVAYAFNKKHIICCVVKEKQQAGGLYEDLERRIEIATANKADKKDMPHMPEGLEEKAHENPMDMVDCTYLYTTEMQYFWVGDGDGSRVWERKNWLGCVPLAVGLCVPLPSNQPHEYALGMVYPSLKMMQNEEAMLGKANTSFEFYTFPMGVFTYQDGHQEMHQIKPTMTDTDVVKIDAVTVQANYQSMEMLSQKADVAIARVGIPDSVTLGDAAGNSGYQENILQAGPNRRVEKQIEYAGQMMARHFTQVLKAVEILATEEMATLLGAKDSKKYLSAFSTVSHPYDNPDTKSLSRVALSKKDVEGYTEVEVSLKPELAQDENAKYNRGKLAKDVGISNEGIIRNILKLPSPDQELAWERDDMLKDDPMWHEFMLRKAQQDLLKKDPKLAEEFAQFVEAKQAAMANTPPPAPSQPQDPNQPPPMSPEEMAAIGAAQPQMGGLMNPQGGLTPDLTGMSPDMLPPAMAGQVPTYPNGGGM